MPTDWSSPPSRLVGLRAMSFPFVVRTTQATSAFVPRRSDRAQILPGVRWPVRAVNCAVHASPANAFQLRSIPGHFSLWLLLIVVNFDRSEFPPVQRRGAIGQVRVSARKASRSVI